MKIKEFIEGRNVSYQTVRAYIVNHPKIFKGHVGKKNNIVLDNVAVEILEAKYPLATAIEMISDPRYEKVLADYNMALKKIVELQHLVNEQGMLLATRESNEKLLEEKSEQVEKLEAENRKKEKIADLMKAEIERAVKESLDLHSEQKRIERENELLKSRTFFDRLFNKQTEVVGPEGKFNKIMASRHADEIYSRIKEEVDEKESVHIDSIDVEEQMER